MTRSQIREIAVHVVFAQDLNPRRGDELIDELLDKSYYETCADEAEVYASYPSQKQAAYLRRVAVGVLEHGPELDAYIEKYAKGWAVGRISRVAVAIMRVAMYEILYMPDVPGASAINEAVEIAKKYEDPETVAFVNGILGSFIRAELPE